MAKVLKLSEEEMNMKGAPEGELHLAAVMERFEVPEPNGDPATILARLRDQLATRQGLHEWHEQFGAADIARGIILYESRLIDKAAAKEVGQCIERARQLSLSLPRYPRTPSIVDTSILPPSRVDSNAHCVDIHSADARVVRNGGIREVCPSASRLSSPRRPLALLSCSSSL